MYPGLLKVLIVGADDLDRLTTVGEQQPYYILECGQQRSKSKTSTNDGCNPIWNSAHKFTLSSEEAAVVIIKDVVTKGIIGQAIIDLTRARHTGKDDGVTPIVNLGGNPAGSLNYKLKFTPDHSAVAAAAPAAPSQSNSASEAVSRSSSVQDYRPGGSAAAAAAAADRDDDPTLASVSNKVSLAKQAMQQLTAELAELTGAEPGSSVSSPAGLSGPLPGGSGAPFARQPQHSTSMREQHSSSSRQYIAQQHSLGAGRGYPAVDEGSGPRSPTASQSPSSGRRPHLDSLTSFHPQRGTSSPHASGAAGEVPSPDELLSLYGGEQQLSGAGGGHKDLVLHLQAALAAAHAEKVSADEELAGVKQAMAVMSRQHYMDMKRMRDSSSLAGAGPPQSPGGTPRAGIFAMVDTRPGKGRDSREGTGRKSSADGATAAASPKHSTLSVATAGGVAAAGEAGAALLASRAVGSGEVSGVDSPGGGEGSPVPAYKLRIQVHQLERQLAEQQAKLQEEAGKREAQASQVAELQSQLDSLTAELRQADANTRAAEAKAAEQATQAAAARAEVAAARAHTESSSSKEAALATELAEVKSVLQGALAEKAELEEALGLLEKNNAATVAALQADLARAAEEASTLRQGNSEVAALQAQLAAAQEEASGLRNNSEEVEYLQAQLRRTLRQVVELQHQVQVLQSARREADGNDVQEAAVDSAIQSEHEFLMQELVATKLELAQLKEAQLVTQRQLYKAQQSILSPTTSGAI